MSGITNGGRSVTDDPSLNFGPNVDFTIELWLRAPTTILSTYPGMVTKGAGNNTQKGFMFQNTGQDVAAFHGKLKGLFGNGTARPDTGWTTTAYNDDSWHYAVLACDRDGNMTIYVDDGTDQVSGDISGDAAVDLANGLDMEIGARGGYPYTGMLDEVRLSDTLRDAAWRAAVYRNGSAPADYFEFGPEEVPPQGTIVKVR